MASSSDGYDGIIYTRVCLLVCAMMNAWVSMWVNAENRDNNVVSLEILSLVAVQSK